MSTQEENCDKKCPRCKSYKYPSQFINPKGRELKTCSDCRDRTKRYRESNKEKIAEYNAKNKEKIAKYKTEWYAENKENRAKYLAEYKEKNKEKIAKRNAEWYVKNKDDINKRNAEWRAKNTEKISQKNAEWRAKNKERISQKNAEYREKKKCALHGREGGRCRICDDEMKITISGWIKHSRNSDKKYNRYDADNFIDNCFLEGLLEDYTYCYWEDCKVKLQYLEKRDDMGTIERLNNSLGHIKSNCVLACWKCNCRERKSDRILPS